MATNQFSRKTCASLLGGFRCLLVVGLFWTISGSAQLTTTYADQVTINSHVNNAGNAVDAADVTNFATLDSYGGIAVGIGAYSGELELEFPTELPAGTTSYVHIGFDGDVLNALLGGNLGGALADLLGTVILGNHYFNVEARNGTVSVLSDSSQNNFGTEELRLIVNSNGDYLLAITPNLSYDRIYIEDVTAALLVGSSNSMRVYSAFYVTGQDPCEAAFATSFDGSGGTVDLVGLGQAGVTNPEYAIDGNTTTASELSPGVVTVGGSISQTIYFQSLSAPTDEYHLRLFVDSPALLNLSLLDGITIEALDGGTVVSSTTLSALLDVDLLGLLNTDQVVEISSVPGTSFDRIRVTVNAVLDVNLSKTVEIYEAYRSPAPPEIPLSSQNLAFCFGTSKSFVLSATTANTNELLWYGDETGGMPLAITPYNGTYTTGALMTDTTYYVAIRTVGCLDESSRTPIEIIELPIPDIGHPTLTVTTDD